MKKNRALLIAGISLQVIGSLITVPTVIAGALVRISIWAFMLGYNGVKGGITIKK